MEDQQHQAQVEEESASSASSQSSQSSLSDQIDQAQQPAAAVEPEEVEPQPKAEGAAEDNTVTMTVQSSSGRERSQSRCSQEELESSVH